MMDMTARRGMVRGVLPPGQSTGIDTWNYCSPRNWPKAQSNRRVQTNFSKLQGLNRLPVVLLGHYWLTPPASRQERRYERASVCIYVQVPEYVNILSQAPSRICSPSKQRVFQASQEMADKNAACPSQRPASHHVWMSLAYAKCQGRKRSSEQAIADTSAAAG